MDSSAQRAFAVADSLQTVNQLPVTTRATSANTSDCFKRALNKTPPIEDPASMSGVLLQMTTASKQFCRGGEHSKGCYLNSNTRPSNIAEFNWPTDVMVGAAIRLWTSMQTRGGMSDGHSCAISPTVNKWQITADSSTTEPATTHPLIDNYTVTITMFITTTIGLLAYSCMYEFFFRS